MSWKRSVADTLVGLAGLAAPSSRAAPQAPRAVLVLRNNDIGDLVVVTPLFEALRRRYPTARIVAGIGDWNRPVLANNPYVDDVMSVNGPWHNKAIAAQSPVSALGYIATSPEVERLRSAGIDIGIDVLGSPWGALLLMRAGVPWRLGVHGYAGGHRGVQQTVDFDTHVHVGSAALRFAELLGATDLPPNRPQIYLTPDEERDAEARWRSFHGGGQTRRVLIAPGGGLAAKCWPIDSFATLARHLSADPSLQIAVVGAMSEAPLGEAIVREASTVQDLIGTTTLRELFALVACADLVIANSSVSMHVAAAFGKPAIVLLGQAMPLEDEHERLWAHAGSTYQCGRRHHGDPIASPAVALRAVAEVLNGQRSEPVWSSPSAGGRR